ncbi:uncharacterized protein si:ch211-244c8.4 [Hippocampus zosterae]|uniref:uncharacterized protein si:ch211-244c8.4 n=1 Tax=Hippocampus zosterae TaxID=109293 RepID=UPI00223D9A81|nr:uncharacterized protein si:ch211-244c8.4 [Hippocampus zosterae]
MDVQMENADPPPCESQPSGKIRKGFKLFGKRKPGNIFSLKNNKSPVTRSQTLDGLPEGAAPDSEHEADKEKAREVSQGDGEHAAEEPTGEDGVLAAARNSISSTGSTKTLSFFSRLRGTRRGEGGRKVHTVCQPSTRQRQGLKGLFGSMKLRPKDEGDKVDAPPSPLLMSSRSNSVEIIKEDIGLTPKSQPRSLESPDKASSESSLTQADDENRTEKDVGPVPAAEAPAVPAESSLGSLLDDISSLLTFESISGGDIMADVKAEWSKARCGPGLEAPELSASPTFPSSGPAAACPLTSTSRSPAAAGGHSLTDVTTSTSSSVATSVATSFTKSSTLTTGSVKPTSDFSPASEQPSAGITIKSPQPTANAKLSPSPPTMAAASITRQTIPSTTPVNRASLDRTQESTCNFGDMASSDAATPPVPSPSPTLASVSKPPAVAASRKPAPLSPSSPATCTRPDSNVHSSSSTQPQNVAPKVETAPSPVQSHLPFISLPPITATISKPVQTPNQPLSNRISVTPESPQPEPSPTAFTSFSIAKKSPVPLDSAVVTLSKELRTTAVQSPVPTLPPVTVSKDPPVHESLLSSTKDPPVAGPTSTALTHISASVPKSPAAPVRIQPKSPDLPAASLLATPPAPLPSDTAASNEMSGNEPSTNGRLSRSSSAETRTVKAEEQHNGSRTDVPKERRTQVRALSKIPVVGGGRVGKQPVRDGQRTDDDSSRDPPTPIEYDGRHLDFHSTGSGDKGCGVEVRVATFKPSQGESQPPHHSKAPAGAPRDSKIPVKHGAQSPPASQTPQAKEIPRTKIPVSRVPVRRVANKPATAGAVRK